MLSAIITLTVKAALAVAACVPVNNNNPSSNPPPSNPAPVTPANSITLHLSANTGFCLDVQGNKQSNGTPVQVYQCNGTGAQKWVLVNGALRLAGTNFCLDAGSYPGNGVQLKIWQCYDGLAAQQWTFGSNKLTLKNKNLCLDLPDGNAYNGHVVQTWTCDSRGTTPQKWASQSLTRRDSSYDAAVANVKKATCTKASATPGKKAGLAGGNLFDYGNDKALFGWWYDWSAAPELHPGGPLAIPMLWGDSSRQTARYNNFVNTWSVNNAPAYVLGFNEPDCTTSDSSDLSVAKAAQLWNSYIAPLASAGSFLVSPSLCGVGLNGDPAAWHRQFKSQISGDYDAMGVHLYTTSLAQIKDSVNLYYSIFNKPLWITEFACVESSSWTPCSESDAKSFVAQVVDYFESESRVKAYALVDVGGAMVTNWGYNVPSAVGLAYIAAVQKHNG